MKKMIKICLDAGHYAKYNQSPANKKYWESEAMWKLTEYLKEELKTYEGVHVKTTRKEQKKDLTLYNRGMQAKGYDLFISNHSNAVGNRVDNSVDYVVVYRSYKNKNNANELGLKLANAIADIMETKQPARTSTRKSEQGEWEYYGVLRGADDAGCPYFFIIENSFHTNKRSTEWLLKNENLKQLAKTQAKVIADYFKLFKKGTMPSNKITSESSKEDIRWAQKQLNEVLPSWHPRLVEDGIYGPKTRIAVLVYWEQLGWGRHMRDTGKGIGKATRKALAEGRKA
ncbi:MAG TPA: N-acetylmuramoyl-L-alanine amidase [Syntrophomonadaceae bacterium]|nr:N-acetylmuramoyl-L-alanine amidase [Syntrophomonadaceae bacterium]